MSHVGGVALGVPRVHALWVPPGRFERQLRSSSWERAGTHSGSHQPQSSVGGSARRRLDFQSALLQPTGFQSVVVEWRNIGIVNFEICHKLRFRLEDERGEIT